MNIENLRGVCITNGISSIGYTTPKRVEYTLPSAYRLAKRTDSTLVLQGAYRWQEGNDAGQEWRDIPTVELVHEGESE